MILLTKRFSSGYDDENDYSTSSGVFSDINTAEEALIKEYSDYTIERHDDGHGIGRFKISKPNIGSAFNTYYDYQTIILDKLIN